MRQVALVGRGKSWHKAPFKNSEIWSMNDLHSLFPQADRWFEMHRREDVETKTVRGTQQNYWEGLKTLNIPIYMQKTHQDLPHSVKYPFERVNKYRQTFASTVSYMLALAIDEGYDKISLYGIGYGKGYVNRQKESIAYWVGLAEGKGIEVFIYPDSLILSNKRLYGYQGGYDET